MCSRRSAWERYVGQIRDCASRAEFFVFNGDMVDFRWSRYRTADETSCVALNWIEKFIADYPQCRFYFLIGNHDNVAPYVAGLRALSQKLPNVVLEPYWLKLGSSLFLHGDVCNLPMTQAALEAYRARYLTVQPNGLFMKALYELIITSRLHTVAYVTHPRHIMAARILHYLNDACPQELVDVTDIYFGHTHAPFRNFSYERFLFHNSGSAIRGLAFRIFEVTVE